jgi:hypothetical protein
MLHLLTPQAALAVLGLAVLYLVVRHARRCSIAHLPGPDSDSWLVGAHALLHYAYDHAVMYARWLGNVPSFLRPEIAAEADFRWTDEFGLAFRTKSCFGVSTSGTESRLIFTRLAYNCQEDDLYLADPKVG